MVEAMGFSLQPRNSNLRSDPNLLRRTASWSLHRPCMMIKLFQTDVIESDCTLVSVYANQMFLDCIWELRVCIQIVSNRDILSKS